MVGTTCPEPKRPSASCSSTGWVAPMSSSTSVRWTSLRASSVRRCFISSVRGGRAAARTWTPTSPSPAAGWWTRWWAAPPRREWCRGWWPPPAPPGLPSPFSPPGARRFFCFSLDGSGVACARRDPRRPSCCSWRSPAPGLFWRMSWSARRCMRRWCSRRLCQSARRRMVPARWPSSFTPALASAGPFIRLRLPNGLEGWAEQRDLARVDGTAVP